LVFVVRWLVFDMMLGSMRVNKGALASSFVDLLAHCVMPCWVSAK
jgi:hypothetical protein